MGWQAGKAKPPGSASQSHFAALFRVGRQVAVAVAVAIVAVVLAVVGRGRSRASSPGG